MSMQTRYRTNPVISFKDEGDEGAVLYNPDTDKVIIINAVGAKIWRFIEEARTSAEIVAMIMESYSEISTAKAQEDLKQFFNNFEDDFINEIS